MRRIELDKGALPNSATAERKGFFVCPYCGRRHRPSSKPALRCLYRAEAELTYEGLGGEGERYRELLDVVRRLRSLIIASPTANQSSRGAHVKLGVGRRR